LQGYISKGLQNNLDIRIAMQNIVAAQLLWSRVKRATFLVYLWERTGRIKCCLKQSVWAFLQDQYRSIPISRKFLGSWYMGKIRSNKRAANAAYLQTTAANQAIKHN
jgi:hypothetical protein